MNIYDWLMKQYEENNYEEEYGDFKHFVELFFDATFCINGESVRESFACEDDYIGMNMYDIKIDDENKRIDVIVLE